MFTIIDLIVFIIKLNYFLIDKKKFEFEYYL